MPDWISHLAVAYILGRVLKVKDKRLLFLGAVLPDLIWVLLLFLVTFLNFNPAKIHYLFTFLLPFHTPFMLLIMAGAIATVMKNQKQAFALLAIAVCSHFLLDLLILGEYVEVFYPVDITPLNFGLFWPESIPGYFLIGTSALILIYAFFMEGVQTQFELVWRKRTLLLLAVIIVLSISTSGFVRSEYKYFKFSDHPELWEGKQTDFHSRYVTGVNPILIGITDESFEAVTDYPLKKGDQISFTANYTSGKLVITSLHVNDTLFKFSTSFIGLIFATLLIFKQPRAFVIQLLHRKK